ncbi:MAG: ribonuclease P protein component [Puniceicoccaceae bacterium]
MRYSRQQHLRKAEEFQAIRASGTRRECGFFYFNFLAFPERTPPLRRAGFIASRRVGNAVKRNRAKRLLREAFRRNQDRLPASCDVVFIARSSINDASLAEIEHRLLGAIKKVTGQ